jgi:hypothetical protein
MTSLLLYRLFLVCLHTSIAATLIGCGPEGAHSVHVDNAKVKKFMALPDRRTPGPPGPPARGGTAAPKRSTPRR